MAETISVTALTPPLIYKYAEGERDFSVDVRYNAIKKFLNKELEQIERENKFKGFY